MPSNTPVFQPGEGSALDKGVNHYLDTQEGDQVHWASYDEKYLVLVYSVGLNKLLDGTDLATLVPDSWRCVLATDQQPVISCEVGIDVPDDPSTLLSVCHDGCEDQLSALRFVKALVPDDYELRLLTIPALSIEVFWLKAPPTGAPDFVVAVDLRNSELPDRTLIPIDTFLETVRPLAKERMTFRDCLPQ